MKSLRLRTKVVLALVASGFLGAGLVTGLAVVMLRDSFSPAAMAVHLDRYRGHVLAYYQTFGSWEQAKQREDFRSFIQRRRAQQTAIDPAGRRPPPGPDRLIDRLRAWFGWAPESSRARPAPPSMPERPGASTPQTLTPRVGGPASGGVEHVNQPGYAQGRDRQPPPPPGALGTHPQGGEPKPAFAVVDDQGRYILPAERAARHESIPWFGIYRWWSNRLYPLQVNDQTIGFIFDEQFSQGDEAFAGFEKDILLIFLVAFGITMVLIGTVGWLLGNAIARPIGQLTEAVRGMKQGLLDRPVAIDSHDEIGQLASEFVEMRQQRQQAETDLARQKEHAERAQHQAELANQAKSLFLSNMSHELRTPLNAVIGFSQLMQRDVGLTDEQKENLAVIRMSGEHLLQLIDNFLSMSKIEAGKAELVVQPFEVRSLLKDTIAMFELVVLQKGLRLDLDIHPTVPHYVETDEGKLRQVLVNLLSNAVKFTQDGGISVQVTYQSPDRLRVEVIDSGVGIAATELPKLFRSFEQTAAGRASKSGTGLGLALSRSFIQLMGGEITVKSQPDQGTAFQFEIAAPMSELTAPKTDPRQVVGLAPGSPVPRILVADDRVENRRLLGQLLSMAGFEVREAVNGNQAIEIWHDWRPHLIWMDLRMPELDGWQAMRHIKRFARAQQQFVVIVALTASAFQDEESEAIEAGFDGFVRKPFREQVIFETIAQHLKVKYLYANLSTGLASDLSSSFNSRSTQSLGRSLQQDLQTLPDRWLRQMLQAAREADFFEIEQLIHQLPTDHAAIANQLQQMLNQYDYDRLQTLLASSLSGVTLA